jgi:fructose-specific phosphotransferase system IIC component
VFIADLLLWWLSRHSYGPIPVLSTILYSILAGYAAGIIATTLYPIFQPDGVQHVLRSLQFPTVEAAVAFFWFPIRLLSWIFGGIAGLILVMLSRKLTWLEWRPQ